MNPSAVRIDDLPVTVTDVLIVGAGPTGLMAGVVLNRRGVPAVVVDRKAGPTRESRALAVQARTMEIYDQLGLAETVLEGAFPAMRMQIGEIPQRQRAGPIATAEGCDAVSGNTDLRAEPHEELLADSLAAGGGDIRWRHRLVDLIDKTAEPDGRVEALLEDQDGGLLRVWARWCIGANGVSSAVRRELNLPFEGNTDEATFWVADVRDVRGIPEGTMNMRFGMSTFAVAFPLGPGGHTRLVALAAKDAITQDEALATADAEFGTDARTSRLVLDVPSASPRGRQVSRRIGFPGRRRRTRPFPGRGSGHEHRVCKTPTTWPCCSPTWPRGA